jgi:hypothetical protein
VKSENADKYENVVIRKEQEVGINNFGLDYMVGLEEEIERLNNIIKEVREYIETLNEYGIGKQAKKELLEILDKGE